MSESYTPLLHGDSNLKDRALEAYAMRLQDQPVVIIAYCLIFVVKISRFPDTVSPGTSRDSRSELAGEVE
jgi:hypothetical protein